MKELKCPKCGSVFTVDESDYADIVNQVKNAEFNAEVDRRIKELEKQQSIQQQADELKAQQQFQTKQLEFNAKLAEKENEIVRLKADIAEGATKIRVAVLEEQNKSKDELQKKEQKIAELKNELTVKDKPSNSIAAHSSTPLSVLSCLTPTSRKIMMHQKAARVISSSVTTMTVLTISPSCSR